MVGPENKGESSEEKVQYPQEDSREYAKIQAHRLKNQELKRAKERVSHGPQHRFFDLFARSLIP